jgi:hypothetical protein
MGFTVRAFIFIAVFFFASVFLSIGLISAFGVSTVISVPLLPHFPSDINWFNPLSYGAIVGFAWGVISYIITCMVNFLILTAYLPSPLDFLMYSIFGLFFLVVVVEWLRG